MFSERATFILRYSAPLFFRFLLGPVSEVWKSGLLTGGLGVAVMGLLYGFLKFPPDVDGDSDDIDPLPLSSPLVSSFENEAADVDIERDDVIAIGTTSKGIESGVRNRDKARSFIYETSSDIE